MNLFHVYADGEQSETRGPRMWLVIADSLFEAMSLIPGDLSVKAVEVQIATVAGPGRLIGSMGARTIHKSVQGVSIVAPSAGGTTHAAGTSQRVNP